VARHRKAGSYCGRTERQKKIGFRVVLLGMIAASCVGPRSLAQQPARSEAANPSPPAPQWVREKIEAKNSRYEKFTSKTIGQEVSYVIYVPADYERKPQARYPVMYWLHGKGGGQGGIPRLIELYDAAIESGKIPPMLMVFVNGMRDSFYCDSADGKMPVETVIIKDLIPHIDSTYRTIANRGGRIVEGFSMGGFGAAHLGFKYPELFGTVSIIDGSLTDSTAMQNRLPDLYQRIFGGSPERFAAEDPRALAEKNAPEIRGKMAIRLAVGALEEANRSFHQQLTNLNIPHDYDRFEVAHNPLAILESLGDKYWQFYRDALSRTGK
jgi:enterochelin esterase-like enzyme